MADALDKIRAGTDKARRKLAAHRLGGREWDVVVKVYQAGNDQLGTAGTWSAGITLDPRPATDLRGVFRTLDGGTVRIGDAEVSGISRSYTEADLRGPSGDVPSRWVIDGRAYSLVTLDGSRPTEWRAILQAEAE